MLVNRKQENYNYKQDSAPQNVNNKRPSTSRHKVQCLCVVILLAFMAMFKTVQSEIIVSKGYELVQIKAQVAKIQTENEQLRLQIARLKSPQRIQTIAMQELGMIVPQNIYCGSSFELVKRNGEQRVALNQTKSLSIDRAESKKGH